MVEPSWVEHIDLFKVLFTGASGIIVFFVVRTLKQIDSNQRELSRQLGEISKEFYILKGEHKASQCVGK